MRDTVCFLICEGFDDWQAALALCEIRRPGDRRVITASHLGSVEFAGQIIRSLQRYSRSDPDHRYRLFKHAQLPPWCVDEAVAV